MIIVLLLPMVTVPGSKHNCEQIILIDTSLVGLLFAKFSNRKYISCH